ncbi:hypothetical protein C723_2136 [Christiangramia flava JLT2011]|uniref:Uncharacterized protein n=1 Tax=Christiangramia flava JLT2011 TaxID=1229726 RepID=A0A1L7I6H9_9FLAO|nr:hypothetical protein GRFL_2001 [Christiangramia flava JLT2011]OSS39130.1 hypothetical protein C723_2136 [Christiangramia flava JLT2011]
MTGAAIPFCQKTNYGFIGQNIICSTYVTYKIGATGKCS